jgi:hypothetical protein
VKGVRHRNTIQKPQILSNSVNRPATVVSVHQLFNALDCGNGATEGLWQIGHRKKTTLNPN